MKIGYFAIIKTQILTVVLRGSLIKSLLSAHFMVSV